MGEVDNLTEGKLLHCLRLEYINRDSTLITTGSCNVLKLNVELPSKLTTTAFMVFGVSSYLGLCNVIASYDRFRCVSTKIKYIVWTSYLGECTLH